MQKIDCYILPIIMLLCFCAGCSEDARIFPDSEGKYVSIKLVWEKGFSARTTDDDNLASEQVIKNLSIFFTEPSSTTITHKYIHPGFTSIDEYSLVTLPLEPGEIQSKDIYIVANYENTSDLDAISTLDGLKALKTPAVDKNQMLLPENGFCMYGSTLDFNFNDGSNSPAIVNLKRTCAKIRVTVTFPEGPDLSTNNSFLLQSVANYTYVIKNSENVLEQGDYFTYAAPIALVDDGSGKYINTTYIYEARQAPKIHIYTHINNEEQEYSTDLPIPLRNHLYDISIDVYSGNAPTGTKSLDEGARNTNIGCTYKTRIKVYDENGKDVR